MQGHTDSYSYAEYNTLRGSKKIIIRLAMLRSVSTGFHDIPNTGQLTPVSLFNNSANFNVTHSFAD